VRAGAAGVVGLVGALHGVIPKVEAQKGIEDVAPCGPGARDNSPEAR
jgi:hypothetical protein